VRQSSHERPQWLAPFLSTLPGWPAMKLEEVRACLRRRLACQALSGGDGGPLAATSGSSAVRPQPPFITFAVILFAKLPADEATRGPAEAPLALNRGSTRQFSVDDDGDVVLSVEYRSRPRSERGMTRSTCSRSRASTTTRPPSGGARRPRSRVMKSPIRPLRGDRRSSSLLAPPEGGESLEVAQKPSSPGEGAGEESQRNRSNGWATYHLLAASRPNFSGSAWCSDQDLWVVRGRPSS
jgi:hypothetical protein